MAESGRHPAVLAGLLGSAAWAGVPTVALADPVEDVVGAVSNSLLLQFVVGCVIGAVVAGAISLIYDRLAGYDDDDATVGDAEEALSSSLSLVTAAVEAAGEETTGDLGRFRTGQITVELPALTEEVVTRLARPATSGPRHFAAATGASRPAPQRAKARRTGRHFASSVKPAAHAKPAVAAPEPRVRGRHFASAVAALPPRVEVAPEISEPLVELAAEMALSGSSRSQQLRERLAALPLVDLSAEPAMRYAAPPAVEHVDPTFDTMDLAAPLGDKAKTADEVWHTPKESKHGITGRIMRKVARGTWGVREALAERLGGDALEGVPRITRADGTTIDVGTSWFDETLAPAITGRFDIDDTAAHPQTTPATEMGDSRAIYISHHVAEVNVGLFPERRDAAELGGGDAFEQALAAMGENLEQGAARPFRDAVGGPSTIDDPDGLEGPTGFIPFRVPAAHPEVVDADTYVDYLVRDEISHSGSEALKRSSHAHLRVIEGGTGKLRTRKQAGQTESVARGRHFAPATLAAQA